MSEQVKIFIETTSQNATAELKFVNGIAIFSGIAYIMPFIGYSTIIVSFGSKNGISTVYYNEQDKTLIEVRRGLYDCIIKNRKESEGTKMKHNVTITTKEEKTVEEYWEMIATNPHAKCIDGVWFDEELDIEELDHKPTIEELAQFLFDTKADLVRVNHNCRFAK